MYNTTSLGTCFIEIETSIKKLKEKIFFSSLKYILGSIFVPRNLKFYTFIISSTLVKFQWKKNNFWWNEEMSNILYFQLQKYNFFKLKGLKQNIYYILIFKNQKKKKKILAQIEFDFRKITIGNLHIFNN